jgi:hypothetical protein
MPWRLKKPCHVFRKGVAPNLLVDSGNPSYRSASNPPMSSPGHSGDALTRLRPAALISKEKCNCNAKGRDHEANKNAILLQCLSPEVCRVSDAGRREPCDIHLRPASESRQGANPRAIVRGGGRALCYGDLAEAEGASAGAQSPSRRLMTRWLREAPGADRATTCHRRRPGRGRA